MEEDVRIAEEVVCSIWDDSGCDVYLGKRERDALNNLIKGYQDLVKWKQEDLFVPKSKIKDTVEELKEIKNKYAVDKPNYKNELSYAIEVLQEFI